jgi:hypothetical protein
VTELDDELVATELFELLVELTELEAGLLDDDCAGAELLATDVVRGIEHSFTPPGTRAPKVASEHTKLPESTLYVNVSARPNATVVDVGTEQVLPSLQMVTKPEGRLAARAVDASAASKTPEKIKGIRIMMSSKRFTLCFRYEKFTAENS